MTGHRTVFMLNQAAVGPLPSDSLKEQSGPPHLGINFQFVALKTKRDGYFPPNERRATVAFLRNLLLKRGERMLLREFVMVWHLAMFTKSFKVQNQLREEIERRSLGPKTDIVELRDWPPFLEVWHRLAERTFRGEVQRALSQPYVSFLDPRYPPRLAESFEPPTLLFTRGNQELLNLLTLGVVGARGATDYTKQALVWLERQLAPMVIASGLAYGADAIAHRWALSLDWPTIAVLGNALDVYYPQDNRQLQQEIAVRGLLVSEYPPGTRPKPYRFVARNRLIAGLSHGLLVTEAAEHSGSLITANLALQNNRDVYALPNRFDARFGTGTNALIQVGALLVANGQDIMNAIQFFP